MNATWELVNAHTTGGLDNSTYRMRIPEGWLYRYGGQLAFVPTRFLVMNDKGELNEIGKAA